MLILVVWILLYKRVDRRSYMNSRQPVTACMTWHLRLTPNVGDQCAQ